MHENNEFSEAELPEHLRECKRCLLLASNDEENYRLVQEYIEKIPNGDRTDNELYNQRLDECKNCDELISGTCLKCGCYVEFRASFKKRKCPMKKW